MADETIDINVVVTGKEDLQNLSVAMRNLVLGTKGLSSSTRSLDARQRALNSIFGNGRKSAGDYAKSLRETVANQKLLGQEINKTTADIKRFNSALNAGKGGAGLAGMVSNLEKVNKNLKSSKFRMLASDLRSVGIEMKRIGKDSQFVGRSLIIGLTAPIIAFGRIGVQNFYAVEKQLVRLQKLLGVAREDIAGLTKEVESMSYEFGIAKELLLAVTGDFAELGINSNSVLQGLTEITAQFAILGDMDVSAAQDLTQTLYQGILNTMNLTGKILDFNDAAEAQEFAIKNVRGQMVMFNAIENATALSMREIAETLPEISAAGQIFGLSFTEMMAILAPMKAIGIDVNAAATGMKVSFQKMVNPTIKMSKELQRLSEEAQKLGNFKLADDFLDVKGIGMDAIQALVNVTAQLQATASGSEEVLNFYAELFDDRQSTRMLVAMRDLANFQEGFFARSATGAATAQGAFIEAINKSLAGTQLYVKDIQTLSEVTALANASFEEGAEKVFLQSLNREATVAEIKAAKNARAAIGKINEDALMNTKEKGKNMVEEIASESGKAMMIAMLGSQNAMARADRELNIAKESTAMSIDRIRIAFKNLSADFINTLAPVIEKVSAKFIEFVQFVKDLSPQVKTLIVTIATVAAALGPLVFIFGQLKLGFGVMLEGVMRLVPNMKNLSLQSVVSSNGLLNLKKPLTMAGDSVVNLNSRFATLVATLSSGDGVIARMSRKFGEMTGMLSKTRTAGDDVMRAVSDINQTGQRAISKAFNKDVSDIDLSQIMAKAMPSQVITGAAMDAKNIAPDKKMLELMPGPKPPLALPAAGQTGRSPKWTPIRGLKGRMQARMVSAIPMPETTTKIMGELMPGPPIKTKAEISQEYAAARKAAKAARNKINKETIAAAVKVEQKRLRRLTSKSESIKLFDRRGGSFTDQLFENVGTGGMPAQGGQRFVDEAISRERMRASTRPRRILRSVLRKSPIAPFVPPSIGQALPFEEEITPRFMQRKYTGKRPVDKIVKAPKIVKEAFSKGLDAIDKPLNKFADASVAASKKAKSSIIKNMRSAASSSLLGFENTVSKIESRFERMSSRVGPKFDSLGKRIKSSMPVSGVKTLTFKARDLVTAPLNGIKKAINAAKLAQAKLNAQMVYSGKAGASVFQSLRVKVMAFTKSIWASIMSLTILRSALMMTGVMVAILAIVAVVVLFIKNFDKIRTQAQPGIDALRNAFNTLKEVVKALIAPFMDFIAMLGGSDKGASKADKVAAAFNKIGQFVEKAAKFIQEFVNKYVVPLLYRFLTMVMKIIGGVVQFIKGIIKLKDNWREGLKMMWDAVKKIGGAILGFLVGTVLRVIVVAAFNMAKLVVKAFFLLVRGAVMLLKELVKFNVKAYFAMADAALAFIDFLLNAFSLIPRGFGNAIEIAANIFADFIDGIANAVRGTPIIGWLADKAGIVGAARSGADAIRNIGSTIGEAGRDTADFINRLLDSPREMLNNFENNLLSGIDSVADSINGILQGVSDGISGAIDSASGSVSDWMKKFGANEIGIGAGKDFLDGMGNEVDNGIDNALDPTIPNAGQEAGDQAGQAAGEAFKEAFADALKDLQQKFVDLVLDSLKSSIDLATEKLQAALELQKEKALAVYDAQIEALDKLQKAEESLTKEKEYQLERRKMLDERELQRTNYVRNRALAIYEGRIDDARMLSLQEQVSQREFTANITKLDEDRRRDLISENMDYLRESIAKAKEETARLIDEQIQKFQEAAKEITKFPPLTIEEYTSQLMQLNEIATGIAGENGNILKSMMDSMHTNLQMPNENLGVFATGLDQLVTIAKDKYGLLDNKNTNSIVGATVGMLASIKGQIVNNAPLITGAFEGIVDNVFDVASTLANVSTEIVAPALAGIEKIIVDNNPFKALEKAVKDANETILREMQRTVGHVASIVDQLTKYISQTLIELTRAQVAAQQAGQQTPQQSSPSPGTPSGGGAGGGGADGGGAGGGGAGGGGNPPPASAPKMPTLYQMVVDAVNRSFASGIGQMLPADKKQFLKQSTIDNLIKAKRDVSFFDSHRTYLANWAGKDPFFKVALQLWDAAGSKVGLPFKGAAPKATTSSGGGVGAAAVQGAKNTGKILAIGTGAVLNPLATVGAMLSFNNGGFVTKGFKSSPVPAILHGGEYVVSSKAVSNIGLSALNALNNMRYMTPGGVRGVDGVATTPGYPDKAPGGRTENINIYVETFIGQEEWFKTMVKQYNMTVLPAKKKAAGMESRVISTYSGLSRGM